MSKVIYLLELYLCRNSLNLEWLDEFQEAREICIFITVLYPKALCHVSKAEQTPALQKANVIVDVAKQVQAAIKQHL